MTALSPLNGASLTDASAGDAAVRALAERIEELFVARAAARARDLAERQHQMVALAARWRDLDELVAVLDRDEVQPRLRVLADAVPHARLLSADGAPHIVAVVVEHSAGFPARAEFSVRLRSATEGDAVHIVAQSTVVPVLLEFSGRGVLDVPLHRLDRAAVCAFLDARTLAFAEDILRVTEPRSPYRRDGVTMDPVCGMELLPDEIAETLMCGERAVSFCGPACRDRFLHDGVLSPGSYAPATPAPASLEPVVHVRTMHPEVASSAPGECSNRGMALKRRSARKS